MDQQCVPCPCGACKCGEYFTHPFGRNKLDKNCDDIVVLLIASPCIVNIGQDKIHINARLFSQGFGRLLGNLRIICGAHVVPLRGEIDVIASLAICNDKRFAPRYHMGFKGDEPRRRFRSKELIRTRLAFVPEIFHVSAP